MVIDEAHRLKNRNCKLLEGLKNLNMVSELFIDVDVSYDSFGLCTLHPL